MANGASYSDQAVLSLNAYPFMFKILFVPFLDTYYFKRFGKPKTLILVSGLALFVLLFFFGAESEAFITKNRIWVITILWFVMTIFVVLLLLSADIWPLTILGKDIKHIGGILASAGANIGDAIGYNLFVLLNSKDWWNDNIFKNSSWKLEREFVTHKEFIRVISLLVLFTVVYCVVFVKDKVVESFRAPTLALTLKRAKKMLQVHLIFKMLLIYFFYEIFVFLFNKSVELKFIEYGVEKTTLVNYHSAVLPFKLALMALAPFFAKKEYLIRQVLGFQLGTVLGSVILFVLLSGLRRGSEPNSAWMMIGFGSFFEK